LALVGQDLGVDQPGVVIHGVVEVRGPGLGALLDPDPGGSTQEAVPAAVGDPPELLDVHVDQVPRGGVLVAQRFGFGPQPAPGGRVGPGQPWGLVAGQDLGHGRGIDPQPVADPCRTPPPTDTQTHDPVLGPGRQLGRAPVRAAGPVTHPRPAVLAVPGGPPLGRGGRDPEPFSSPAQRPTLIDHAAGQTQPAVRGQRSITVGHEDLRAEM